MKKLSSDVKENCFMCGAETQLICFINSVKYSVYIFFLLLLERQHPFRVRSEVVTEIFFYLPNKIEEKTLYTMEEYKRQ